MAGREQTIPLAEEQVSVGRRTLETGRVRVGIESVERVEPVDVTVAATEVSVARVPVGRFVAERPVVRTDGDVTVIPVVEERVVVTVRLYLVEELHVRSTSVHRHEVRDVTLRREHATVERLGPGGPGAAMAETTNERETKAMSDPVVGPATGLPGVPTDGPAGTDAVGGPRGSTAGGQTLACLFATRTRADEAREELVNNGTPTTDIHIASQDAETGAGEGGGMWESIKRLFTGDDGHAYHEGVNRGHTLLTVHARSVDDADRLAAILERYDPIDLDTHEANWRSEGWTGRPAAATSPAYAAGAGEGTGLTDAAGSGGAKPAAPAVATGGSHLTGRAGEGLDGEGRPGEDVIPIVEENLAVGKRAVAGGSVRVRSYAVERPVEEDVRLRDERVHVEHRAVDRELGADQAAFKDRTIEMTESREEPVVEKTARVTGEVGVRKEVGEHTEHVSDTVRKTEVEVDDDRATRGDEPPPRH